MGKFYFGAVTSAHQVEGGNHNDWTEWEKKTSKEKVQKARKRSWPDFILHNYPSPLDEENYISGRAGEHYNRYSEDFDIAKSLGHNAHRFSIEWSRVEPRQGQWNENEIEHYREVITALKERGLEPIVTLWHYTLPIWLADKGGFSNNEFPRYFRQYVQKIMQALGQEIKFVITLNEMEFLINGYYMGVWPPQKKGFFTFLRSLRNGIQAHKEAFSAIKEFKPDILVGIAKPYIYFEAASSNPINLILRGLANKLWNHYILDRIGGFQDFVGLNYYMHDRISYGFHKNKNERTLDMYIFEGQDWELYPLGIYYSLKELHERYKLPILITENGLADAKDEQREWFIAEHLKYIKRAMQEGVDVWGYLHWSLLDNFEWDKGFGPRFGLVEIDYKTYERRIRPSALAYKKMIEDWPNI